MLLLKAVLEYAWVDMPKAPEVFRKFLCLADTLDRTVLVTINPYNTKLEKVSLSISFDISGSNNLIIETNIAFLLNLYLRAADKIAKTIPSVKSLINDMEGTSHRNYLRLLAFRKPSEEQSIYVSREESVLRPGTDKDSEHIRICLEQTIVRKLGKEGEVFYERIVPGIWESINELASKGIVTDIDSIEEDLVRRGLLLRGEDITDWPPKPISTDSVDSHQPNLVDGDGRQNLSSRASIQTT
jgi:hypothetical protein